MQHAADFRKISGTVQSHLCICPADQGRSSVG